MKVARFASQQRRSADWDLVGVLPRLDLVFVGVPSKWSEWSERQTIHPDLCVLLLVLFYSHRCWLVCAYVLAWVGGVATWHGLLFCRYGVAAALWVGAGICLFCVLCTIVLMPLDAYAEKKIKRMNEEMGIVESASE